MKLLIATFLAFWGLFATAHAGDPLEDMEVGASSPLMEVGAGSPSATPAVGSSRPQDPSIPLDVTEEGTPLLEIQSPKESSIFGTVAMQALSLGIKALSCSAIAWTGKGYIFYMNPVDGVADQLLFGFSVANVVLEAASIAASYCGASCKKKRQPSLSKSAFIKSVNGTYLPLSGPLDLAGGAITGFLGLCSCLSKNPALYEYPFSYSRLDAFYGAGAMAISEATFMFNILTGSAKLAQFMGRHKVHKD